MIVGAQTGDGVCVSDITTIYDHIAAAGDNADAVVCGIGGGDIERAREIGTGEIADQICHHLPGGTEEAEQGVLAQLGGIGRHRVATAIGGDRGGTAAGGDADGVVGGISGGDRHGAARPSSQHRAGEVGNGEVVGVVTT